MQTLAGFEMQDGVFHITDWAAAIFNPSFVPRFFHMALASLLTAGFVVAGVSAWYLVRGRAREMNRKALSMALWMLLFAAPAQLLMGDYHGLNTFEHQPTKVAAMEGHWETKQGAPLLLFAIPDSENETNHFEVGIPHLASLILTHEWNGTVHGVTEAPKGERPPVGITFWAFRIMVGLGTLMILFALWGLWTRMRGKLDRDRTFLRGLSWFIPAPFIAVVAGWFTTETGRAPWLVYGEMTQAQAVTPSLTGGMALATLIGYIAVYAVVFTAGVYYVTRIVRSGPDAEEHVEEPQHAKRPLSASDTPFDNDALGAKN
jgi:cytochrome d ubiquinol oxidase subunit I